MNEERDSKISTSGMKQTDNQKENVEGQRKITLQQFVDAFEAFLNDC